MQFIANYHIVSINYREKTRVTKVEIVCEDTGEIFIGKAHRNKADKPNIQLGANLALARAIKKMVSTACDDEINTVKFYGSSLQCDC